MIGPAFPHLQRKAFWKLGRLAFARKGEGSEKLRNQECSPTQRDVQNTQGAFGLFNMGGGGDQRRSREEGKYELGV